VIYIEVMHEGESCGFPVRASTTTARAAQQAADRLRLDPTKKYWLHGYSLKTQIQDIKSTRVFTLKEYE
jgi:hypothetical protein